MVGVSRGEGSPVEPHEKRGPPHPSQNEDQQAAQVNNSTHLATLRAGTTAHWQRPRWCRPSAGPAGQALWIMGWHAVVEKMLWGGRSSSTRPARRAASSPRRHSGVCQGRSRRAGAGSWVLRIGASAAPAPPPPLWTCAGRPAALWLRSCANTRLMCWPRTIRTRCSLPTLARSHVTPAPPNRVVDDSCGGEVLWAVPRGPAAAAPPRRWPPGACSVTKGGGESHKLYYFFDPTTYGETIPPTTSALVCYMILPASTSQLSIM